MSEGGYSLYTPHQNISNFTVIAESANLEVFWIDIDKLIGVISERCKSNFIKMLEQSYITILRRIHEKLMIEFKRNQEYASRKSK